MVVAIKPDAHRNCVLYFALADEAISRSLLSHRFNTRIRAPPFPTSLSLFFSFFLSFSLSRFTRFSSCSSMYAPSSFLSSPSSGRDFLSKNRENDQRRLEFLIFRPHGLSRAIVATLS